MYAEIDPRKADQQKHRRRRDPEERSHPATPDARTENRRERAEEDATCQRVAAGKAV